MSQGNEHSEGGVVALVIAVVIFMLFKDMILKYIIMVWKPIMQGYFTIWAYAPESITSKLFLWVDGDIQKASKKILEILKAPPMYFVKNKIMFEQINLYSGKMIFPYVSIIFGWLAYKMLNKKELTRIYDIDKLSIQESNLWPQIKPVLYENIHLQSLHTGPWAAAKKPEKYVRDVKAIIDFEDDIGDKKFRMDKEIFMTSLLKQMGKPWGGASKLEQHERQLFALYISKICREKDLPRTITAALSRAYTSEKFSKIFFIDMYKKRKLMKEANKLVDLAISKHENNKDVVAIVNKHFFKKTVLAGLLETAREDGVLPTSDFIWLKKKDRVLWYLMSNLGRRAAFAECSGIWCHYLAEKAFGRKVAMPMVYNAVKAMDVYLEACSAEYIPLIKDEDDDF